MSVSGVALGFALSRAPAGAHNHVTAREENHSATAYKPQCICTNLSIFAAMSSAVYFKLPRAAQDTDVVGWNEKGVVLGVSLPPG